jgi:hypothetical protein
MPARSRLLPWRILAPPCRMLPSMPLVPTGAPLRAIRIKYQTVVLDRLNDDLLKYLFYCGNAVVSATFQIQVTSRTVRTDASEFEK